MTTYVQDRSAVPWLNQIIAILDQNGSLIFDLLVQVLRYGHVAKNLHAARLALHERAVNICDLLMEQEADVVNNWAASAMINTYQAEIVHLTEVKQGLHFGANRATLKQLEGFTLEDLGTRMKIIAPFMWQMLAALLDSNHCQQDKQTDTIEYEADSLSESMDLFSDDDSIWGDIDLDEPSRENLTHGDTTHDEHEAGSVTLMDIDELQSSEWEGSSQFGMDIDVDAVVNGLSPDDDEPEDDKPKHQRRKQDTQKRCKALMFTVSMHHIYQLTLLTQSSIRNKL